MSFSVLMSVYSKENPRYLDDALCSIWDQQTLKPGQIVLVKDGPLTEELDVCINTWKQKLSDMLTIVELPENVGVGAAMNSGLPQCRYELVARMDSDDVSLSNRFEKQVTFMENNPDIAASSAVLEEWNETLSKYIGVRVLPLKPEEIKKFAKYRCPLSQPVAILRKSAILSVGGYQDFRASEDYALWSLLLTRGYKLANLPDVLLKQRAGRGLMKRRGLSLFLNEMKAYKYQYTIGFFNKYEYLRNTILRFFIRISPNFVKTLFYKYRHIRKYQFFLAVIDITLLFLAVFLSLWVRDWGIPSADRFLRLLPHFIPIIAAWVACFYIAGFYSLEIPRMGYRMLSSLSMITVICTLLSFAYFYLNIYFPRGPRTVLVIYGLVVAILTALWRLGLNRIALRYTAKINVAFIGINDTVIELIHNARGISHLNYRMMFLFDENYPQEKNIDVTLIKDASVLIDEIKKNNVQIIVFNNEVKLSQSVQDVLFELIDHHLDFISIPDFYELFMRCVPIDTINELGLLRDFNLQSKRVYSLYKQVTDVIMALVLFIITLPFWPFIILLIKLETPGPAFFKRERTGYLGRPFTIIKFRTMKIADNAQDSAGQADSRITKTGNFLRKTRIDEIPQFLNVIKADMSFIGPRPERPELIQELEREVPFYRQRLLVKPGLSGWDQVSGEYHSPSREDTYKKLQYDLYYIKNMSFFLDVSIFFKTLVTIVKRGGV
jgi:exopolysaccharide biosynthesis polyprenyl glycosylphosphotransferase